MYIFEVMSQIYRDLNRREVDELRCYTLLGGKHQKSMRWSTKSRRNSYRLPKTINGYSSNLKIFRSLIYLRNIKHIKVRQTFGSDSGKTPQPSWRCDRSFLNVMLTIAIRILSLTSKNIKINKDRSSPVLDHKSQTSDLEKMTLHDIFSILSGNTRHPGLHYQ